jgi:hypothetical protein
MDTFLNTGITGCGFIILLLKFGGGGEIRSFQNLANFGLKLCENESVKEDGFAGGEGGRGGVGVGGAPAAAGISLAQVLSLLLL